MKQLTDEEYVAAGANKCPFCGSVDYAGGFIEVEGTKAHQEITCSECHKVWSDTYQLVGYVEVE